MGWQIAAPIIGGFLGGLGGKSASRRANQPTRYSNTSTLSPYGGGGALNDYLFGALPGAYQNTMGALPTGPNPFSIGAAGQLAAMLGGGGIDLPGIHIPQLGEAPGVGIPHEILQKLGEGKFGAGLGSTGIQKVTLSPEEIARFTTDIPPELQDIARGRFVGAGDPLLDQVIKASTADATDAYSMTQVPALNSAFGLAGRTGSGAHAMAQAYANQEFQEGLQQMIAEQRLQHAMSSRQQQLQGLGLEGQLNMDARGNLTSMRNTDQQVGGQLAAVSAQNRLQAALGQANIMASLAEANAAMKAKYDLAQAGFDMQGSALGLEAAIKEQQLMQSGLASLFGMGQGLYANQRQAALDPLQATMAYGSSLLPPLAQFGTQRSSGYQQGPGVSTGAGALGGAMGGAMMGYGLGNKMFGGGSNAFTSPGVGGVTGNFAGNPLFTLPTLYPGYYGG